MSGLFSGRLYHKFSSCIMRTHTRSSAALVLRCLFIGLFSICCSGTGSTWQVQSYYTSSDCSEKSLSYILASPRVVGCQTAPCTGSGDAFSNSVCQDEYPLPGGMVTYSLYHVPPTYTPAPPVACGVLDEAGALWSWASALCLNG